MTNALVRSGKLAVGFLPWRYGLDAPFWWMALIALATRSLYQPIAGWQDAASYGLGHAAVYRGLYWFISCRFSPWQMALLWLGSPLLLFSATWLRPVWAVVFTALWSIALWWSIRQHASPEKNTSEKNNSAGLAGYLIVLAWVSVCGAGGYGYQSSDYVMHNGRLLDLIHYAWPVSYARPDGSYQLLVQYAGYYLWPALVGKMAGISTAMFVQHLWLLIGCWLVLRMMALLTQVRAWVAAIGLIFFGGGNLIVGLLFNGYLNFQIANSLSISTIGKSLVAICDGIPGFMDFWPATIVQQDVWFGNFISLASSLLWAPNQVVAGWLVVGLLCRASMLRRVFDALFSCALLAYWSPMIALGLLPAVMALMMWQLLCRGLFKAEFLMVLAGVSVLLVLVSYYASVSVANQPHGILSINKLDAWPFVLFLIQSWGVYMAVIWVYRRWLNIEMRFFAMAIFIATTLISCVYYGVYNDLLVRTSSALYFGMLMVILVILHALWRANKRLHVVLISAVLLPGACTGVLIVWQTVLHADMRVVGQQVVDYGQGWQFMGQHDSWFVRYFSANRHL